MTGPPGHTTESNKVPSPKAARPIPELPQGLSTSVYHLSLPSSLPCLDPSDKAPRKGSFTGGGSTTRLFCFQLPAVSQGRHPRPHGSFSSASTGVGSRVSSARAGGHGGQTSGSQTSGAASYSYHAVCSGAGASLLAVPPHGHSHTPSSPLSSPSSSCGPQQQASQTWDRNLAKVSLVVRGRGLSRTPLDEHPPIETIADDDLLHCTYLANVQKAYESQLNTPCSSRQSSPTIKKSQSPLSVSHGGWTTGNTTERSSLDSSYSLDDFDKLAANTVSQHFEEFQSLLFEGQRESLVPQADVLRECEDWVKQFPYLRVLGKQLCPPRDQGFYQVSSASSSSRSVSSSLLLDVTDQDLSMSSDSQGLTLTGRSVSVCKAPVSSLPDSDRNSGSSLSSTYSFLVEEVLEEDGVYEDIIAVDYKNIYEDNMENKKQITPRKRREGYPPITPNACVKDSVISGAFDHIWQEIMSWMRPLLKKYTAEITDSKHDVISFSPSHAHQTTQISPELSLIMNPRPFSLQRSHTHVGSSTDRSIDGILQISSMPLQTRNQLADVAESQALATTRPGSSFQSQHQGRPMSTLRTQRGARGGRLAPLGDRSRTPNMDEERTSRPAAMGALRVKGLTPTISNDPLPSPPSNFHRNGALPPLEMERTPARRIYQSNRASSAIDKDIRFLSFKDRNHFLVEQTRPNTTHTMRSETPFGASSNRRSSTPLGNTIAARNSMLINKALDVRGNSLQVAGEASHFHPDILEDQQEGPVDDVIRTHWNPPPQVSHISFRRGKTSIR